MNLLLLEPEELDTAGRVEISGRRACHLLQVLRVQPGQRVRAGIVDGGLGWAEIEAIRQNGIRLRVHCAGPAIPPAIDLVLAIPRPKALSRILQDVATLGVRQLDLVNAWRVDKSYLRSKRLGAERMAQDLRLGCEQGRTTWLPKVRVEPMLRPYLEALGPRLRRERARCLVADPTASLGLEQLSAGGESRWMLAVGPDGGWIEREITSFVDLGFVPIRLESAVLRTETAIACLISQIRLLCRLQAAGCRNPETCIDSGRRHS